MHSNPSIIITILLLIFHQSSSNLHPCNTLSRPYESNPRGCSWFWMCRDSYGQLLEQPIENKCPDDLYFDPSAQSCSSLNNGLCTFDEENFNNTPTECTNWVSDLIPHPIDCSRFSLCWRNYTIPSECPVGQHFSYFQNGCTSHFLADCRLEHNYCRRMETKAKRSPLDCGTFHTCFECENRFSMVELKCREDQQFNDEKGYCDDAEVVGCEISAPVLPPEVPPQPFSIQCSREDILRHFVPHPVDCHFFFSCASGRSLLLQCPAGSHFDLTINFCLNHEEGFECPELETTPRTTTTAFTTVTFPLEPSTPPAYTTTARMITTFDDKA